MTTRYSRRSVLTRLGAIVAAGSLPARLLHAAEQPRFRQDPFTLGVASGYPTPNGVVLWTRLAPAPSEPGGGIAHADVIPVKWELATDPRMTRIVRTGVEYATPQWAHSVHAELGDLEPDREYWYRFTAGRAASPIGRTRTAPGWDATNARFRVAVASCQQYEHGYYNAYRHMLDDELDLVVHVGDYIYEGSWGDNRIRSHGTPEIHTLDDYRARHALYRGERELQAAHAQYPWLVTWDDHEVENDYAGATSEDDEPREWFLARRAAAYQAFYEHMPLPRRCVPFGPDMHLYTQRAFGQLANVVMLDTRQYRAPLPCTEPGRRNSKSTYCAEIKDHTRSKLGAAQEGWVTGRMRASKARWNLFASGTVMAYVDEQVGPGELYWTDGWNGYPAARERFMDALSETRVANPVILSGDIHAFIVANHHRVPHDINSPLIASEFVCTSITSQGVPQKGLDDRRAINPNVLFASSERRGYVLLDMTPERLKADLIGMDSVVQRDAGRFVYASYVVEAGKPGPVQIGSSG
jgi:alkaline phosphatase D